MVRSATMLGLTAQRVDVEIALSSGSGFRAK